MQPLLVTIAAFCDHMNQSGFTVEYSVSPSDSTDFEVTGSAQVGDWTYPGWRYAQLELHAKQDNEVEQNEPVTIALLPDPNGTYAIGVPGVPPEYAPPDAGTKTIQIIDSPPLVSIARLAHGSEDPSSSGSSTTPTRFEVTRTGGKTTESLTVSYSLSGTGTNPASGGDYTAPSGQVTIPADALSTTFEVAVVDDTEIEAAYEEALVTLTGGGMGQSYLVNTQAPTATATIQDNDFEITAAYITFNSQGLVKDDGSGYAGSHWEDLEGTPGENDTSNPLSFQRSDSQQQRFITANVVFHIGGNPTATSYRLAGTGSGPGGGQFESGWVAIQSHPWTGRYLSWSVQSAEALPTTIDSGELSVSWQVTPVNRSNVEVSYGSTTNQMYVTGAAAPSDFETVVKTACSGDARGKTPGADDAAIVAAIWSTFHGKMITGVSVGMLTYEPEAQGGTTASLLDDGYGKCDAWAAFLIDTLEVNGIWAGQVVVRPKEPYSQFQVKGGGAQGLAQITGENAKFDLHVMVFISGQPDRLYDPSFGEMTEETDERSVFEKWEDTEVADYAKLVNGWHVWDPHENPTGNQLDWGLT